MMAKVMKASGCLILWQSPVSFVLVFSWAKVVQIRFAGLLVSLSPCVCVEHQNGLPASASALHSVRHRRNCRVGAERGWRWRWVMRREKSVFMLMYF